MAPARRLVRSVMGASTLVLIGGLLLASCGGSGKGVSVQTGGSATHSQASETVVVGVGSTPINKATYEHWMAVGAATVEKPKPNGPLPKVLAYAPPAFTACVAQLRATVPESTPSTPLQDECKATYESIRKRILNFLITGFWLRDAAAEQRVSVSPAEVMSKFEEEKRAHYTPESFRRLQEASHQTVPDLEFSIATQMLSAKLLAKFAKEHGDEKNEQLAVSAFNKSIRFKWIPRTSCQPGYVVPDCKQYRPPTNR